MAVLAAGVAVLLVLGNSPTPGSRDAAAPGSAEASEAPGSAEAAEARDGTFTLMQVNLCLSGLAECYGAAAYPAGVDEAVSHIQELRPDAVTVNEACHRDSDLIARRTGYDVRFAPVAYAAAPLPCIDPGGRGLFGHAVLTRSPIDEAEDEAFTAQADLEQRRWLCVTTPDGPDVCTAHLETPHSNAAAAARDGQCAELAAVLAARTSAVVFGGDVNRRDICAPAGFWSRTDAGARQSPGVQHVYGSAGLGSPGARVLPLEFSDHDMLVVSARLAPRQSAGHQN